MCGAIIVPYIFNITTIILILAVSKPTTRPTLAPIIFAESSPPGKFTLCCYDYKLMYLQ